MKQATRINVIPVVSTWNHTDDDGSVTFCFETSCSDYEHYSTLPDAVEMEGRVHVKTGWNSDRCRAFYKSGRWFALPLDRR